MVQKYMKTILWHNFLAVFFLAAVNLSCHKEINQTNYTCNHATDTSAFTGQPNIILIVGDDVGYVLPTYTGGQSYQTPGIGCLAANGMQFTHCYSTPETSPGNFMMLTVKYNFRNHKDFLPIIADIENATIPASYGITGGYSFYLQLSNASVKGRCTIFLQ
jgi:arylsulfatase A